MKPTRAASLTGALFLAVALGACAEESQTPLSPEIAARYATFRNLSEWSAPTPLGGINTTTATDGCPFITKHGDALYFASNREGGYGALDLYVSRWDADAQAWGVPINLGAGVNTVSNEQCPLVLNSGREMIFVSNRPGGAGGLDLWLATRHGHRDDDAWESPVHLSALNTSALEFGPGAYEEEGGTTVVYFNSNRSGGAGLHDLYVSRRPVGGTFSTPTLATELSTTAQEQFAALSKDGREIFFSSDRPGTVGGLDLWSATRERTSDAWGTPVHLGTSVNSSADEGRSAISWDGMTLIFHSNRGGSVDLYQSTRDRLNGRSD